VDCGSGHQAGLVGYRDKNIDTVLGRVTVRRAYYHCQTCRRGVVPRDGELGVAGVSLSPGLRRMVARAATAQPFAAAADLLADLAGIRLAAKRVQRCAEADGCAAAEHVEAESRAILDRRVAVWPPARLPDKLLPGHRRHRGAPMVPATTIGRAGKAADGRARTREVKLACLLTQTTIDTHGQPVRDPDSTSYLGTFAPVAQFATLADSLSLAFLVLLESLSPQQRAAFLLREVFEYPYAEVAEIIGTDVDSTRHLVARARNHVQERRPRYHASRRQREELAQRFFAAEQGDLPALEALLAHDVALHGDGGGKVPTLARPVNGRERVARTLLAGMSALARLDVHIHVTEVNGQPGAIAIDAQDRLVAVIGLDITDGQIQTIRSIVNPDKLRHLDRVGDLGALVRAGRRPRRRPNR
jgi:hypothetical protein